MSRRRRRGPWPPRRPRSLPLGVQLHRLLRAYPCSTGSLRPGRLLWSGTLTPCEEGDTYEVFIDHRLGGEPRVYVISPRLEGPGPLPHTYNETRLCLYVPGTWADNRSIAGSIVPWTMEWLLFYELWAAGADWEGGGVPLDGPHFGGPRYGGRRHLARLRFERRTAVERRRLLQGHRLLHRGGSAAPPQNLPGYHRTAAPSAARSETGERQAA